MRRAFQVTAFKEPLRGTELPVPQPSGNQVLVRITASGVCHTDVHVRDGGYDLGQGRRLDYEGVLPLPLVMGHEIAGEIAACGPDAAGPPIGTRVVVFPWIGCGECPSCRAGDDHHCSDPQRSRALGVRRDGGYSTHVLVPDPRYLIAIGDLDPAAACTLACSGVTAWGAVTKVLPGARRLMTIGAGGVGLPAISLASRHFGVAPVVADIDRSKWPTAEAAGAAEVIDPREADLKADFDAVIDFVGSQATAELGTKVLARGGTYVCVGMFGGALTVSLPLLAISEINVRGSRCGTLDDLRELVGLAQAGKLPPMPLERRPLDAVNAALGDLERGRVIGRIVLQP